MKLGLESLIIGTVCAMPVGITEVFWKYQFYPDMDNRIFYSIIFAGLFAGYSHYISKVPE
ncbi:MAG: hypothetical protein ABIG93_04280 [archaeon]|nr:hypothetical protein [Nanoarchaeota archaeon]